jgi:hypothetical protein
MKALVIAAILATSPAGDGGRWASADNAISITPPNPKRFAEVNALQDPVVAAWATPDRAVTLGVVSTPLPPNVPLIKSGLEEGLCKEFGGTIISSAESILSGVPIYRMQAKGKVMGRDVYCEQIVLAFNGRGYKVMATSLSGDLSQDADIQAVLNSLSILQAVRPVPQPSIDLMTWLSQNVGGTALLVLLVLAPIAVISRRKRRKRMRSLSQTNSVGDSRPATQERGGTDQ